MDPHSTRSQFNRRGPKAGPPYRATSEKIPMQDTVKMPKKRAKTDETSTLLIRRPIATNSRVKQDEMVRRSMYLSFVTNALQQKSDGDSQSFDELVAQFNLFSTSSTTSTIQKVTSKKQNGSPVDTAEIRLWFSALSHVVSRLERTHATLVDAIVNMPWMTLDTATVKAYTLFIGMLLSARPEYLSLVLAKISVGFTHQSGDASMLSSSKTPLTRRTVYERVHYLLRHLLSLIPTLPSTLQPLLVRYFPHKRQIQAAQTTYIRNLLHVSSYCPELSAKILATIVDRAIQIDVEIQIELEELEESESVEDNEVFDLELDPFDVVVGEDPVLDSGSESSEDDNDDTFSDLSSDAGGLDDDEPIEAQTNLSHIQDMVKKLDAILMLLFDHFEQTVNSVGASKLTDPGRTSPNELPPLPPVTSADLSSQLLGPPYTQIAGFDPLTASTLPTSPLRPTVAATLPTSNKEKLKATLRTQFNTLLYIFDRTILRTFKSRYTQFLIFWYTSVDPEFADVFQGMLVERALMPGTSPTVLVRSPLEDESRGDDSSTAANIHLLTPEVTRAAAASYIGSFVSRATFVDREGTRRVVGVLCEFLKAHLEGVEQAVRDGVFGFGSSASSMLASGQHLVFYSVTQALFLIFCFRWRDLMVDGFEDEDEPGSNSLKARRWITTSSGKDIWLLELSVLKRAVSSILNPLKVCSSNVVNQFARIAHSTNFLYCYTILDVNRRAEVEDSSPRCYGAERNTTVLRHSNNIADLNTFFPFDPCRLPKSNDFIQGVYREWESVKIHEDDDEDDEDEDKDETGTESVDSVGIGTRLAIPSKTPNVNLDEEGLGESLCAMSISPAMVVKTGSMHG